MRSFRLWPNITSVAVEWRIQGFRVRTWTFLWFIGFAVTGVGAWKLTPFLGIPLIIIGVLGSALFTAYVYRNDPKLRVSERTLLSLMWRGSKNRYWTNEPSRD